MTAVSGEAAFFNAGCECNSPGARAILTALDRDIALLRTTIVNFTPMRAQKLTAGRAEN